MGQLPVPYTPATLAPPVNSLIMFWCHLAGGEFRSGEVLSYMKLGEWRLLVKKIHEIVSQEVYTKTGPCFTAEASILGCSYLISTLLL